ncbi:ESX secretion-associated protein EspG [Actinokineospora enzanensis]|uniref:ESX secretion-associated protein EspG n=1 Tax=Actinokineospora enzanensis TaxID=155975 RepID=UPI0003619FA1|nr:ESX secretion-associated protein EspG [Actinokineospora enzanensis]
MSLSTQTLSALALDFLWETVGAGELPYPLEVSSHGETMDERSRLRRRVHHELREQGLLDRSGRLEPEVESLLGLIARPELAVDSVFLPEIGGRAVCVLVAAQGSRGVVAVQQGEGLQLTPIRANTLVGEVVARLPAAQRGAENSISMPAEDFERGARGGDEQARRALARLVAQPNVRGGQVAVTVRDRMGGRTRSRVLSWFDKPNGRYVTASRRGRDGREWVTVAPADAQTMRHRIGELVAESVDRD